jgi:hypothetical protein
MAAGIAGSGWRGSLSVENVEGKNTAAHQMEAADNQKKRPTLFTVAYPPCFSAMPPISPETSEV